MAGNDPAGDGELSGQLADESGKPGEDAEEFLSDEQAAYGCYTRPPTVDELDQFFVLDDEDRNLIADKRGDANRLGFMLQLTTLRYLGKFLDDPLDVPAVVMDDVSAQLGIADPSCVKAYSQRVNTKWEHQREITDAPDSPCSVTASSSAKATERHHRKCDRPVVFTVPPPSAPVRCLPR